MSEHLAVLEELKSRLNAIEFDVACGNLSAAQTFTKVRDAHAAAIALMRGQSDRAKEAEDLLERSTDVVGDEMPNGLRFDIEKHFSKHENSTQEPAE